MMLCVRPEVCIPHVLHEICLILRIQFSVNHIHHNHNITYAVMLLSIYITNQNNLNAEILFVIHLSLSLSLSFSLSTRTLYITCSVWLCVHARHSVFHMLMFCIFKVKTKQKKRAIKECTAHHFYAFIWKTYNKPINKHQQSY